MRYHHQNLNERKDGSTGTILKHGRAWLHTGRLHLSWEWRLLEFVCGAKLSVEDDCEDTLSGYLMVPLIGSFYWAASHPLLLALAKRLVPKYKDRELSVRVFEWAIWWNVWHSSSEWSSGTPRWRSGSWQVLDTLFGKRNYSRRLLETDGALLHFPEGVYEAQIEHEECTWKRPRWRAEVRRYYEIKIPAGVPIPGKGENSWDCGEDAIFSSSFRAATKEEAIKSFIASVLETRTRRGGKNWQPASAERRGATA